MSAQFIGKLQLDFGDWGSAGRIAITLNEVGWVNMPIHVTVPTGYMTDGASVPRFLWWFLPPFGDRATFAALLHDYLLDRLQGFTPGGPVPGCETRKSCDHEFLVANRSLGVPEWRARLAWLGVRAHSILLYVFGQTDKALTAQ